MTPFLLYIPDNLNHPTVVNEFLGAKRVWSAINLQQHPDVVWFNIDQSGLKIKEIRDIISQLSYPPFNHTRRCFILCHLDQASIPAQNALLKSLEEPPDFVDFVVTTSNLEAILPTIKSRCLLINEVEGEPKSKVEQSINQTDATNSTSTQTFEKIINASLSQKIDLAGEFKDRAEAVKLVANFIRWLHQQSPTAASVNRLKLLNKAHQQLNQNGNVRLVLEACFARL